MLQKRSTYIKLNDLVTYGALFIAFFFGVHGELRYTESNLIYYLPYVVCLGALLMELMSKRILMSSYLVWRIFLALFFLVTLIYVVDFDVGFKGIKQYVLQSIVVVLISMKCASDPASIKRIMMIAIAACALTTVYIITIVDTSQISGRLGTTAINEVWNANNIGVMSAFGILLTFCTIFVYSKSYTRKQLVIAIVLCLMFGYIMILSGSRKSFLTVLITLMIYLIRAQRSKRVRNLLLAVVVTIVAAYAVYNIPFLYQHLGVRFEGMMEAIFGEGGDKSAQIRQSMVELGMEAFQDKPVLGYGINGYSYLYHKETGVYAYAHNNYVEMLVNGGIVGFLLYYIYPIRTLLKKVVSNRQTAFLKGMLLAMLIADVGCVSYTDGFMQYVLCLIIYSLIYIPTLSEMYYKPENIYRPYKGGR